MPFKPHITVAAVIERAGRFLLVEERAARRLVLNQPAGHLEDAESLVEAVVREVREETAHHFRPEALVGIYLWRQPATGDTFLRVAFSGAAEGPDTALQLDREIVRAVWLSREHLAARPNVHRSPLVMRCIDDYLAGCRFPLSLLATLGTGDTSAADGLGATP